MKGRTSSEHTLQFAFHLFSQHSILAAVLLWSKRTHKQDRKQEGADHSRGQVGTETTKQTKVDKNTEEDVASQKKGGESGKRQ